MELKDLPNLVLILVMIALVLGVGVLIYDNFGTALGTESRSSKEEIQFKNNTNVSLTYNRVNADPSNISHVNGTDLTHKGSPGVGNWTVWNATGYFQLRNETWHNAVFNITYSYDMEPNAFFTLKNMSGNIIPIASDWMPLIVVVAILAVILVLVITSFVSRRR